MRSPPICDRNPRCRSAPPPEGAAARLAMARSNENNVIPSAASGTYRALTSPRISRPHNVEPIPTPIENAARNNITTLLSAPSVRLGKSRQLRQRHRADQPEP